MSASPTTGLGDGIRVVAVWESKQHADRFLEDRLAPALTSAFDEPEGRPSRPMAECARLDELACSTRSPWCPRDRWLSLASGASAAARIRLKIIALG
jgi:hypothetical protein